MGQENGAMAYRSKETRKTAEGRKCGKQIQTGEKCERE